MLFSQTSVFLILTAENLTTMTRRVLVAHIRMVALFAVASMPLWSQVTGRVTGLIKDPSGAAVPDATVTLYLRDLPDPVDQKASSSIGLFTFDSLNPDSYRLEIQKQS